jgi:DNA-binding NarL/FixJ family response regulator
LGTKISTVHQGGDFVITVIIVDDHNLVRQGIKAILEKVADIEVIGEAADGQEAVTLVSRLKPKVVLMDIALPNLNGVQAAAKIQALNIDTRIVILSMYSDAVMVRQALQNGARGYLLKQSVTEELLLAIQAANRDEIYLSPAIANDFVQDSLAYHMAKADALSLLSLREREVLQLIAEGHTNNAIAQSLVISVKTVEKHRTSVMDKLNIHDTAGLVRTAIKNRLITID